MRLRLAESNEAVPTDQDQHGKSRATSRCPLGSEDDLPESDFSETGY